MQKYFTEVESSISKIIEDLAGSANTKWISDQKEYKTFTEPYYKVIHIMLSSSCDSYLQDHLHVYQSNASDDSSDFMVPFHKDKGLILFLTPFTSNPLIIKDKFDETITTEGLQVIIEFVNLKKCKKYFYRRIQ